MKKIKIFLIIIAVIAASVAARFIYMRFIKTYTVGKDPKLGDISSLYYMSSMHSSDYGYMYDSYSISGRNEKYYARTDKFDKAEEKQVVTQVEITGADYKDILQIVEGCNYVRQKASDPNRMDGYMDELNYSADIHWDKEPDGPWELEIDSKKGNDLVKAIDSAVQTISGSTTDNPENEAQIDNNTDKEESMDYKDNPEQDLSEVTSKDSEEAVDTAEDAYGDLDEEAIFWPVIYELIYLINDGADPGAITEAGYSDMFRYIGQTVSEHKITGGYALIDVDGDGQKELLLGLSEDGSDKASPDDSYGYELDENGTTFFEMYAINENMSHEKIITGTMRDKYYLTGTPGILKNFWSNGAGYWGYTFYKYTTQGNELTPILSYVMDSNSDPDNPFYKTEGDSNAERTTITEDEWEMGRDTYGEPEYFEYGPFSDWTEE